jgi:carbonic anhydrase/acetyltransferase-like protein (isoleucine patch superfamily)
MTRSTSYFVLALTGMTSLFVTSAQAADPLAPAGALPLEHGPCPADCSPQNPNGTYGNGIVNIDDLLAVINAFGDPGGPCDSTPANGDGTFGNGIVNIDDLLTVLNEFGECPFHVMIGSDLLTGFADVTIPFPQDFFYPGCLPFEGIVSFAGQPLGTRGPWVLGTTDSVIDRLEYLDIPEPGTTDTVEIQLVELNLQSTQPITVETGNGLADWTVHMGLGEAPSPGLIDATRTGPGEAELTGTLTVRPRFIFTRVDEPTDVRVLDLEYPELFGKGLIQFTAPSPPLVVYDNIFTPDSTASNYQFSGPGMNLQFEPAQIAPPPPPAFVDPTAVVDPTAHLGPNAFVGVGAFIGPQVVIGPNVVIGDFSQVHFGSVIGADTQLTGGNQVGPESWIGDQCVLETGASVGGSSVVETGCTLLNGATIGNGARLGRSGVMGLGAELGDNSVTEGDVLIGSNAVVLEDLFFAETAQVDAGALQTESLLRCMLADGTTQVTTADLCSGANGAVWAGVTTPYETLSTLVVGASAPQVDPNNLPFDLLNLEDDIDESGVSKKNPGQAYVKDSHDCDDFADELEKSLEGQGYDATFTVYWCYEVNPAWRWDRRKTAPFWKNTRAHAITDIHTFLTNEIIWIEPQLSVAQGALTHSWTQLDFDGDGEVEYDTKHGGGFTDGNCRIEVYDSREAAEKAGVVMD